MSISLTVMLVCLSFTLGYGTVMMAHNAWKRWKGTRASKPQYPRCIYDGIDFYGRNYACVVDTDEFLGFTAIETNNMLDMYELCVGIGQDDHAALQDMNSDIEYRNMVKA